MKIFSYGSNMLYSRLKARIPSAVILDTASLAEHRLMFNKRGNDGSAKTNAFYTGKKDDKIWGVVSEIDPADKPVLDRIESLGIGYHEKDVLVENNSGKRYEARTYYAMDHWIDQQIHPFKWYRNFVLLGALENDFPPDYIDQIRCIHCRIDKDKNRYRQNHRILCSSKVYDRFSDSL